MRSLAMAVLDLPVSIGKTVAFIVASWRAALLQSWNRSLLNQARLLKFGPVGSQFGNDFVRPYSPNLNHCWVRKSGCR